MLDFAATWKGLDKDWIPHPRQLVEVFTGSIELVVSADQVGHSGLQMSEEELKKFVEVLCARDMQA